MRMNLVFIVFVLVAFSTVKLLIIDNVEGAPALTFPSFDAPTFEPIDVSGGCSGFIDCTEYLGAVVFNIGLGIVFVVEFVIELTAFLFALFAVIIALQFAGIEGAPLWLNTLLVTPFVLAVSVILFKLVRSGASNA